jgi:hypothetical protein
VVILTLLVSASRTASLLINYSAPFPIYRHLADPPELALARMLTSARHVATPQGQGDRSAEFAHSGHLAQQARDLSHIAYPPEQIVVCVGAEWYRSPGSFFLPSPEHRLAFLDAGFGGLLPFPFDESAGGTRARPGYFNDRNRASPGQFLGDRGRCDYLVEFRREGEDGREDDEEWEVSLPSTLNLYRTSAIRLQTDRNFLLEYWLVGRLTNITFQRCFCPFDGALFRSRCPPVGSAVLILSCGQTRKAVLTLLVIGSPASSFCCA